jgi:hypothetical protein
MKRPGEEKRADRNTMVGQAAGGFDPMMPSSRHPANFKHQILGCSDG